MEGNSNGFDDALVRGMRSMIGGELQGDNKAMFLTALRACLTASFLSYKFLMRVRW